MIPGRNCSGFLPRQCHPVQCPTEAVQSWFAPRPDPFAASVIYSASLAGWAILAISFSFLGWDFSLKWLVWAAVAVMIFIVSF